MKTNLDLETPIGFFTTYFDLLPTFKTKHDAFNYLNNEVKYITGKKPYKNYKEWRYKKAI